MFEDYYFLDEGHVKITAATVGISRKRWIHANEEDVNTGSYKEVMQSNRFDHLPIVINEDNISEYFKTTIPNDFSKIEKYEIKYDDVIPLDTDIRTIIYNFAMTKRSFYFLGYNNSISGLITLGNLNCKQVQIYIFSLICELERGLSDFLNKQLSQIQIKEWLIKMEEVNGSKHKTILDSYEKLTRIDLENTLTEHFYLIDFFDIIRDFNLFEKLNFTLEQWNDQRQLNKLRVKIAHPTKSLLDKENNVQKLKKNLDKIQDVSFRLNKYKNI